MVKNYILFLLSAYFTLAHAFDAYQSLELPKNATDSEIKKAFKEMSLKYHPDKNPNLSSFDKYQ